MSEIGARVIDKEFDPSDAGKRVGWISVQDSNPVDRPDNILIDTMTATVGAKGAILQHWDRDGESLYTLGDEYGFENVTGVRLFIDSSSHALNGLERYVSARREHNAGYVRDGGGVKPVSADVKQWATGKPALTEAIRSALSENGLDDVYPYVYYNLNIQGRQLLPTDRAGDFAPAPNEVIVPDRTMTEITKEQAGIAKELLSSMHAIAGEDEQMSRRLTIFSDIPFLEIPDAFIASRDRVAVLEQKMRTILSERTSYLTDALYIPAGVGPGGRDWPYMNPNAKDAQEAYGIELQDLREGSVRRAEYELRREIKEAEWRASFVGRSAMFLSLLYQLEQTA